MCQARVIAMCQYYHKYFTALLYTAETAQHAELIYLIPVHGHDVESMKFINLKALRYIKLHPYIGDNQYSLYYSVKHMHSACL